jgi:hypothetical protein
MGFSRVASVRGGMIEWNRARLPITLPDLAPVTAHGVGR